MSGSRPMCDITPQVKETIKNFRFRKGDDTSAIILKIDRKKQEILVDEIFEGTSIEELRETLQEHQPRYIILSYKQVHDDGRISYPLVFIYYTPRDSHRELQMMYAGSKTALQTEADISRSYEIRELDELTQDWLHEKLNRK
ncbi:glia maturation factor gamma-like [Agrilus planipennis]|uniref:Glia maturation factor gamma n=1 Tax=Agrilus planipennis TaxID=224129 RepID=A0A1W4X3H9_AGRPL|nr:glia maturation factor gamma [Agrilus planipennis]XP_025829605.1 glia maturation factor gamma-like [Agrilus planipennis]